jgi:hypothetical protein
MTPILPPVRPEALAELRTLALRWLAGFDPFGTYRPKASAR